MIHKVFQKQKEHKTLNAIINSHQQIKQQNAKYQIDPIWSMTLWIWHL